MSNFLRVFTFVFFYLFSQNIYADHIHLSDEEKNYLSNKKYISVASLPTFHPFNFIENGIHKGYSVDVINLMGKKLGKKIKFINKPWNEELNMLKSGELDLIPHIAMTENRKKFIDFTNFIHVSFHIGFALNKNTILNSIKDLNNKTVAVVKKTYLHEYLQKKFPHIKLLVTDSTKEAIDTVVKNRASVAIGNVPNLTYFIEDQWLTNLMVKTINDMGIPNDTKLPMGVKKGNKVLKSIIEKAHKSITLNEYSKIKEKWMKVQKEELSETSLTYGEKEYLDKKNNIKICVLPNWLPFEQIDETQKHRGIGADILNIISKKIDKEFVLVPTKEWSKSLQNIRDRKCDVLPVAMDVPSRRDSMDFTKPYLAEPFVVATTSDKFFIKDETELSYKKVGIVKSYAFIEVLKSKNPLIEIVEVKDTKEGLERVSNGELYGYIDTMPTIGYFLQKYGYFDLKIAGKLNYDIALSIASRNDEPLLNSIIQKSLNEISHEEIRKIVGRWIEIRVHQEFDYQNLFYVVVVFTIIFIVILYKNSSINSMNKRLEKANYAILESQKMVDKYVLILTTDLEGKITTVNDAYCETVGFSKEQLIGKNFTLIKHPDMKDEFFDNLWETISKKDKWIGEIKNLTKDNQTLYFRVIIESLYDENEKKIGYRSISENITDKKRIEELSITDSLTKLNNRLKIDDILEKQVEVFHRYKIPFSIILFDLDDFKKINDTYGHDIGDYALKTVAKIVQDSIRKTDEVGRWGGEEFIIISSNTTGDNAQTLAENIRNAISSFEFRKIGSLTISLGVTEFKEKDTINALFKRVDKALYDAKNSGKNKTVKI